MGKLKTQYKGEPVLPIEPFARWLQDICRTRATNWHAIAERVGYDEAMIRRWGTPTQPTIRESSVERIGIELIGDPRLAAQLYPELAA